MFLNPMGFLVKNWTLWGHAWLEQGIPRQLPNSMTKKSERGGGQTR